MLTTLTSINLSRNNLKHIPGEIIFTLTSLELFDLSSQNQPIRQINDYAFDRESNKRPIKRVLLHNNSISVISKRAFCSKTSSKMPYVNIKELNLSENRVDAIDSCVFRQLAKGYAETNYTSKLKLYSKIILNPGVYKLLLNIFFQIKINEYFQDFQ
jgi:hypothetical protein